MKSTFLIAALIVLFNYSNAQKISPYYGLGNYGYEIEGSAEKLINEIQSAGYEILGSYAPGQQPDLYVVVFTDSQTRQLCMSTTIQGLIAAPYRMALEKTASGVILSCVNPEYQWRAYLTEAYGNNAAKFLGLKNRYMNFLETLGHPVPFGGEDDASDLEDYHYMFGMPYYEDQVEIKAFDSFQSAVSTIQNNITGTQGIEPVYSLVDNSNQIAVFGVGLVDQEIGEKHFLSVIGQTHAAALPYELIVEGNKVKMLHGRFRFALYWPELTMATFTKIMSTPGDVEEMMSRLVR